MSVPIGIGTVADACHAARELTNPAFLHVLAEDDARRADSAPATAGPLRGMPCAVKDNIDVAGMPTTVGHPGRTAPATSSAVAVARLVAAGAVVIGKTNLDQFATGLVGTRSPFGACHSVDSTEHVSGGSSSGSAVAVAAGIVAFALATDTAGSGRVPAAFNGIVGIKPTRGLVSTRGVFPASPSLDCVSVLSRTVATGRAVLDVIAAPDPLDPWSRQRPAPLPAGVAATMRVVGVPIGALDLDDPHRDAWVDALSLLGSSVRLVPVDVTPLLEAATLLYGPLLAERLAAFGHLLEPDSADLDPVVRQIVLGAREITGAEVFAAQVRLRSLAAATAARFAGVDAIVLPVTPGHPRLADVRADPIGANTRLGTYTNMANLLDLCAAAIPIGRRPDGLPFGVQLLAPAFADQPLLDLAGRVLGETSGGPIPVAPGRALLAVCGAHLSGQPQNHVLRDGGGLLHARARTAGAYRMVRVDGALLRPGLVEDPTGPADGFDVELWDVSADLLRRITAQVEAPLRIGPVRLADGTSVAGFVADPHAVDGAPDITEFGGWRAYLDVANRA